MLSPYGVTRFTTEALEMNSFEVFNFYLSLINFEFNFAITAISIFPALDAFWRRWIKRNEYWGKKTAAHPYDVQDEAYMWFTNNAEMLRQGLPHRAANEIETTHCKSLMKSKWVSLDWRGRYTLSDAGKHCANKLCDIG